MDVIFSFILTFITLVVTYVLISSFTFRRLGRLPPGPYPIPVIGNILQLGKNPNQSLAKLSKIFGPLMSLKLGTRTTIVVSSPMIAREILQKHDLICSSRTIPCAAHAYDHHKFSMGWLPVSNQWRILRKISKEQMLSMERLDASQGLRQEKLQELIEFLQSCCVTELKKNMCGVSEILGQSNLSDYFPLLRYIDPQGILRKSKHYFRKVFDSFDSIIQKRLQERGSSSQPYAKRHDLLEALLDQMAKDESYVNVNDIKHFLLDLFVAGADATPSTIEWGMTQLLRSPEIMAKARAELHQIIGQKKAIEESDISKLPYLQAIVKETLRLHPAAPLLFPRKADANVEISGYKVPKDADILINAWAIGRDPMAWSDPEIFIPERFLESGIDIRGKHFEVIPFGGGRRICPGLPLAYRMVHLVLAIIIHNFHWKLPEGIEAEDIDMEEQFGLAVHKEIPIKAIPFTNINA